MQTYLDHVPPSECIWRVHHFGGDDVPPAATYWHSNQNRKPAGVVVFQLTTGGELLYRKGDDETIVPAGHALLHAYDEPTGYGMPPNATENYRSGYVALYGEGLRQHWDALRQVQGDVLKVAGNQEILSALHQLNDAARPRTPVAPTRVGSLVYGFVMTLFRHVHALQADRMHPVDRAINAIVNSTAYDLSTKEFAATHGVSREHLSRVFHERTGQTPSAYIAKARLDRAVWLLQNTHLTIAAIARQSGYASTHTLARQVRTATGHSPSALRGG